ASTPSGRTSIAGRGRTGCSDEGGVSSAGSRCGAGVGGGPPRAGACLGGRGGARGVGGGGRGALAAGGGAPGGAAFPPPGPLAPPRPRGVALVGVLGPRAGDDRPVGLRQALEVRRALDVLQDQLADAGAAERPVPGEQLLEDDGQAVLVAEPADVAVERLRGG